jgi:hypothetical protein
MSELPQFVSSSSCRLDERALIRQFLLRLQALFGEEGPAEVVGDADLVAALFEDPCAHQDRKVTAVCDAEGVGALACGEYLMDEAGTRRGCGAVFRFGFGVPANSQEHVLMGVVNGADADDATDAMDCHPSWCKVYVELAGCRMHTLHCPGERFSQLPGAL